MVGRLQLAVVCLMGLLAVAPASAHEGHDHDKPPPLNLPVAPRVIAVTPELELVGVLSGRDRLTIFLHAFASNAPIGDARISVTAGSGSANAKHESPGVFSLVAPWLADIRSSDLVFALTMSDGSQDLLTGRLQIVAASDTAADVASSAPDAIFSRRSELMLMWAGGLMLGTLLTLFVMGARSRRVSKVASAGTSGNARLVDKKPPSSSNELAAAGSVVVLACLATTLSPQSAEAAGRARLELPMVPATMAADIPQRLPDGTLFVPKATQHLLSVRTVPASRGGGASAIELTGTIIPGPEHFGRVQPGRPGRIESAEGGLAYIGKRVEKGQILAYVLTYIEAADRANIDSVIAEAEGRIEKLRTIVSRYDKSPGAVPQVRVDEMRGELDALMRKRAELLPGAASRVPVLSPISGVVSVATATIGQIVDARDILFEIVDPSQFWVEAHGHGHEGNTLQELTASYALASGGHQIPLEFAGRGLALRHQSTVLTFKIAGRYDGLSIGQPVKVILQSNAKVDGFVLPASAIVRGQTGLPIVWIKTEAERFEPQPVKVESLDGRSVVVTAGLKEDQRVVTEGVTLLNQIR